MKKVPAFLQKEETKEAKMSPKGRAKVETKESPAKKKAEAKFGYANGGKVKKGC